MAFEILEGTLVLFRSGTRSKTLNFGLFSLVCGNAAHGRHNKRSETSHTCTINGWNIKGCLRAKSGNHP